MSNILPKTFEGSIMMMRLEKEREVMLHSHDFLELVYIVSGTAQHDIGGISGELKAGDFFVIDYNTEHRYFSKQGNLTVINCLFLPELFSKSFSDVKSFNDLIERYFFLITRRKIKGPASNQVFTDSGEIGELLSKMCTEYKQKQDGYTELLKSMLCEILIRTVRKIGSRETVSDITAIVLEYIQKNYMKQICLKDMCEEMHYSIPYMSAKFKEETGYTFTALLQNKRIEEACRLLCETNLSVGAIAEKTGYTNIKFFNKVFRRVTKTSPLKYKSQGI